MDVRELECFLKKQVQHKSKINQKQSPGVVVLKKLSEKLNKTPAL